MYKFIHLIHIGHAHIQNRVTMIEPVRTSGVPQGSVPAVQLMDFNGSAFGRLDFGRDENKDETPSG